MNPFKVYNFQWSFTALGCQTLVARLLMITKCQHQLAQNFVRVHQGLLLSSLTITTVMKSIAL